MIKKKNALPFDKDGGVTAIQLTLLNHPAWIALIPQAKVLMTLMQVHWRHDKPVAYGIREAMQKVPCAKGTARRAFKQLEEHGFIEVVDESIFDSRSGSKTRTWHLTWLPRNFKFPANDWKRN